MLHKLKSTFLVPGAVRTVQVFAESLRDKGTKALALAVCSHTCRSLLLLNSQQQNETCRKFWVWWAHLCPIKQTYKIKMTTKLVAILVPLPPARKRSKINWRSQRTRPMPDVVPSKRNCRDVSLLRESARWGVFCCAGSVCGLSLLWHHHLLPTRGAVPA